MIYTHVLNRGGRGVWSLGKGSLLGNRNDRQNLPITKLGTYRNSHRECDCLKATQEQFNYFKYLFEHERSRYQELINRGKLILSVITLYLGLLAVAADKSVPALSASVVIGAIYFVSVTLLVVSLALVVLAVGIYKYENPSDPKEIVTHYKSQPPSDDDFRDQRIVDFAVATDRNSKINQRRANLLRFGSFPLLLGVLGQAILLVHLIIFQVGGHENDGKTQTQEKAKVESEEQNPKDPR